MGQVKEYILALLAAGIICALLGRILKENKTSGTLIKVLSGVFMVVTMIGPLKNLRFDLEELPVFSYSELAQQSVAVGQARSEEYLTALIKTRVEAYILHKAEALKAELTVEVTLNDSSPPTPEAVLISGNVSPYAKSRLAEMIENDIGIPEELQQWI